MLKQLEVRLMARKSYNSYLSWHAFKASNQYRRWTGRPDYTPATFLASLASMGTVYKARQWLQKYQAMVWNLASAVLNGGLRTEDWRELMTSGIPIAYSRRLRRWNEVRR
jgi:hypothetical protein